VENQYTRAVTPGGNAKAQAVVDRLFERRVAFGWRGLGEIPRSALRLRAEVAAFDAERRFDLAEPTVRENRACRCPDVLRGAAKPTDCALFGGVCTPANPVGACMVSGEGACAAYWAYRRHLAA
jgi:hydrogenase expression/formation protein HypD